MQELLLANLILLALAAVIVLGIMSSVLAMRFGAPLLLVFLGLGMLIGEDGPGGLRFDNYAIAYLIGSGALAIILFDGGMRTRVSSIRTVLAPSLLLSTLGVVVTAGLTGIFAHYVIGLGWLTSLLLGSIVASTDAAAVFFLLRAGGLKLRGRVGPVLETESATNDPMALFLTLGLIELIIASASSTGQIGAIDMILLLLRQFALGGVVGVAGGFLLVWVLVRIPLPAGLHPLLVLGSAVLIYSAAALVDASGFLAAYLGGLVLGNRPARAFPSILSFMDSSTWMAQLFMFLVLGLLVTPSRMADYVYSAMLIAGFLMLVARPVGVWLSLALYRFRTAEIAFISWVGLRGAVSIFLAILPVLSGLPGSQMFFNLAFVVVLVSLILQGGSLAWSARRLGLALPDTAPSVKRFEIELPGQQQHELVAYPIESGSAFLTLSHQPVWLKPVFVVRGNEVVPTDQAGPLQPGDYGYFLVPPSHVRRLDKVFGVTQAGRTGAEAPGFTFDAAVGIDLIAAEYRLSLPERWRGLTLADVFALEFGPALTAGDRIDLGSVDLLAVELAGDRVARVVLELPEEPEWEIRLRNRIATMVDRVKRRAVRP